MKRIPIEMLLGLLLLGVAIGVAWSRWTAMEAQVANHNARLVYLEADLTKRLKLKTLAEATVSLIVKGLRKMSLGLIGFR